MGRTEEVHGHRLIEVIVEKGLPRLCRRTVAVPQDARDGALRDRNAEHLELAESAAHATTDWRTPFVRSNGGPRRPSRVGLENGDAVSIIVPRIGESIPAASEQLCRPGRTARDRASRTTCDGERSKTGDRSSSERDAYVFSGTPRVAVAGQHSRGQRLGDRSGAIE